MLFQVLYREEVGSLLAGKEHVSDGVGTQRFLYFILILCAVFFMISIGMSTYMLIRRHRLNLKKAVDNGLIEKYQDFLSGFLVLPIDDAFLGIQKQNKIECRLDVKDISDPYRRKLLSREIYELKKNLCGQQESQLSNYFFGLGLQTEVAKMLDSSNWVEKVKAIQMVQAFNINECLPVVQQYVNSKNRELAIEAICAMLTIEKSTDVLFTINQKLNNWECHKIVDALKRLKLNAACNDKLIRAINNKDSHLQHLSIGLKVRPSRVLHYP